MADSQDARVKKRCPICKAEAVAAFMPFCSKRCAEIDLGKWFTASYVVSQPVDDDVDGSSDAGHADGPSEH